MSTRPKKTRMATSPPAPSTKKTRKPKSVPGSSAATSSASSGISLPVALAQITQAKAQLAQSQDSVSDLHLGELTPKERREML